MRSHVVLFGDSITEQSFKPDGWGAALANTYTRKVDVVVRGYGGYNIRSLYGDEARELSERTNEVTGVYAQHCIELAKELGVYSINLWSKMQETEGWQKKFLSDGLHLTAEGNAVVHGEVVRVFSEGGLDATQMPSDYPHHSEIDPKNLEKSFLERSCKTEL